MKTYELANENLTVMVSTPTDPKYRAEGLVCMVVWHGLKSQNDELTLCGIDYIHEDMVEMRLDNL